MKIDGSNVVLRGAGFRKVARVTEKSLEIWGDPNRPNKQVDFGRNRVYREEKEDQSQIKRTYDFLSQEEVASLQKIESDVGASLLSETDKLRIKLIQVFMSIWLDDDFKMDKMGFYMSDLDASSGPLEGWGINYSYYEEEARNQSVELTAKGTVLLEDGREIQVDYHLHMSERSYQRRMISFKAGDALIDPIVINYEGSSTHLTQEKYAFDIDMDGAKDQISFATKGSGFLALDKNNNWTIDDGSELFGPSTNDGFSELKAYDADGNGWIDENDKVFGQLSIWERNPDGTSKLMGLGEVGIGAIYLKDVTTLFDLSDDQLELQGKMKTSSIFLKEDGRAGSVHEIDLVV